jgi:hypothetical protein
MAESWRNILERAADNLSIELERMPAQPFRHTQPAMRRTQAPAASLHSFTQSRDMLARELQALTEPPRGRMTRAPSPAVAPRPQTLPVPVKQVRPAFAPPAPRKRSAWRNLLAVIVSALITGAAI